MLQFRHVAETVADRTDRLPLDHDTAPGPGLSAKDPVRASISDAPTTTIRDARGAIRRDIRDSRR